MKKYDIIFIVNLLRTEVKLLRTEVKLLRTEVKLLSMEILLEIGVYAILFLGTVLTLMIGK